MDTLSDTLNIETYIAEQIAKLPLCQCGSKYEVMLRERCGADDIRIYFGYSNAWGKVICPRCGSYCVQMPWMKKPENKSKRSRKGAAYYRDWWRKEQGGILTCWLCGQRENEITSGFDHHHIDWLLEDGTEYPPEEIRMVCNPCHDILTSIRRFIINQAKGKVKLKNDWCGADDCLCAINANCNHEDRENCESRIERAA